MGLRFNQFAITTAMINRASLRSTRANSMLTIVLHSTNRSNRYVRAVTGARTHCSAHQLQIIGTNRARSYITAHIRVPASARTVDSRARGARVDHAQHAAIATVRADAHRLPAHVRSCYCYWPITVVHGARIVSVGIVSL